MPVNFYQKLREAFNGSESPTVHTYIHTIRFQWICIAYYSKENPKNCVRLRVTKREYAVTVFCAEHNLEFCATENKIEFESYLQIDVDVYIVW